MKYWFLLFYGAHNLGPYATGRRCSASMNENFGWTASKELCTFYLHFGHLFNGMYKYWGLNSKLAGKFDVEINDYFQFVLTCDMKLQSLKSQTVNLGWNCESEPVYARDLYRCQWKHPRLRLRESRSRRLVAYVHVSLIATYKCLFVRMNKILLRKVVFRKMEKLKLPNYYKSCTPVAI